MSCVQHCNKILKRQHRKCPDRHVNAQLQWLDNEEAGNLSFCAALEKSYKSGLSYYKSIYMPNAPSLSHFYMNHFTTFWPRGIDCMS